MTGDSNNSPQERPNRRGFLTEAVALGGAALGLSATAVGADPTPAVNPRLYTYVGGKKGGWTIVSAKVITGDPLPAADRLEIVHGSVAALPEGGAWILRGVTSNERYANRDEKNRLAIQAALGRPQATHGAFIPIRKSVKWWALTQDERRSLFEERSKHITIGIKYLPAIARRLPHCRDLSENEPFDFLTIFDYAKADSSAFDDMMAELRATEEWKYVDREFDIRVVRADA